MLGRLYPAQICSAARTLEIVGERWSLLIARDAMFAGMTRFSEFQRSLGVAPNILAKRLADFVEAGIFEQTPGADGRHAEYTLTDKGRELQPIIIALTQWGDRWAAPDGPPITFEHDGCGGRVSVRTVCARCDAAPAPRSVVARLAHRLRHLRSGREGRTAGR